MQRQPLNPLVSALFCTSIAQDKRLKEIFSSLTPTWNYIVLVPTTRSLLADNYPVNTEDFISSHVLNFGISTSKSASLSRLGIQHVLTLNGRSVTIKGDVIYTQRGFAVQRQVKIISDSFLYLDGQNQLPFLLYTIDQPLLPPNTTVLRPSLVTRQRSTFYPYKQRPAPEVLQRLFDKNPRLADKVQPEIDRLVRELNDAETSEPDLDIGRVRLKVQGVITDTMKLFEKLNPVLLLKVIHEASIDPGDLEAIIEK
jgi:hypothetical protein